MSRLQEIAQEIRGLSDEEYAELRGEFRDAVDTDLDLAFSLQIDAMRIVVCFMVNQLPAEQQQRLKLFIDAMKNDGEALKTFGVMQFDRMRKDGGFPDASADDGGQR